MPYFKSKQLLFIHIPKTGGTIIERTLKNNDTMTLYNIKKNFNKLLPPPYNNASPQHQFYTTLYKFKEQLNIDFDNIKTFTIVRNPYNRIISDLIWNKLIKKDSTANEVYHKIKNKYLNRNDLDNHNKCQYLFITNENGKLIDNIKIFKFEDLKNSSILDDYLGFKTNINKWYTKNYSRYLNNDSISLINEYYKKDFELFNYELKKIA